MRIKYFTLILLFTVSSSFSQIQFFNSDSGPIDFERNSKEENIKSLLREIEQCLYNHQQPY